MLIYNFSITKWWKKKEWYKFRGIWYNWPKIVKLLDFGTCVSDPFFNDDKIIEERMKYQPPEYFRSKGEELNYYLWSVGCFLIDMYSTEEPIYNKKMILKN